MRVCVCAQQISRKDSKHTLCPFHIFFFSSAKISITNFCTLRCGRYRYIRTLRTIYHQARKHHKSVNRMSRHVCFAVQHIYIVHTTILARAAARTLMQIARAFEPPAQRAKLSALYVHSILVAANLHRLKRFDSALSLLFSLCCCCCCIYGCFLSRSYTAQLCPILILFFANNK